MGDVASILSALDARAVALRGQPAVEAVLAVVGSPAVGSGVAPPASLPAPGALWAALSHSGVLPPRSSPPGSSPPPSPSPAHANPPPPSLQKSTDALWAAAGHDALLLRGLLVLTEDLRSRLDAMPRFPASSSTDEEQGDPDADGVGGGGGVWPVSPGGGDATSDTYLSALARDASAVEAALAYRERRGQPTVPVLVGGGGTTAKLTAAHAPWVAALVTLLKHAVLAHPM